MITSRKFLIFILILLSSGLFLFSQNRLSGAPDSSALRVSFLDVGQGDATFIETPNGVQVLIDGGPSPQVTREIGSLMPFGDHSIDLVIATHPDADHIGGLPAVLEEYEVDTTIEPSSSAETAVYAAWQILERQEEVNQIIAERGQLYELDQGVYLTILYPDEGMYGLEGNDSSIVARLSYGDICFLLMGDADSRVEAEILATDSTLLDCDVLKVGHHGSRTSTSFEFISAVSPQYAVISAGQDNRYGHPHKEVVEILERADSTILKTFEHGMISFETNGRNLLLRN